MRNSIDEAMSFTKPKEPKKTKPTWSGWDSNTDWKPESGYIQPQFNYEEYDEYSIGCEDRPDMQRPNISMIVDDTQEVVTLAAPSADAARRLAQMEELKKKAQADKEMMPPPTTAPPFTKDDGLSKAQRKKEKKLFDKIVKPKGWNENWSEKEAQNQSYEVHYTEDDIKFGFPTVKDSKKSQLSIDSIWSDQLFDSDKYQDWEDEWAEFDRKKQDQEYNDDSQNLPIPVNPDQIGKFDKFKKPPDVLPPRVNLPPEFKPSSRDAWAKGFQDALRELEQEAIWKAKGNLAKNRRIRIKQFRRRKERGAKRGPKRATQISSHSKFHRRLD